MPASPLKHGQRRRTTWVSHTSQQPIRQSNNLGSNALFPIIPRRSLLNRMREDAALGVKVEYKQARKRLVGVCAAASAREPEGPRNSAS